MTLNLKSGEGTRSGTFAGTLFGDAEIATDGFHAYHPANVAKSLTEVTLPTEYEIGDNFTNSHAIMKGTGAGSVQFKHLGGVLKFVLADVPAKSAKVRFTTLDNKNITGDFTLSTDGESEYIAVSDGDGTKSSVMAVFTPLTAKSNIEISFPLPVGSYQGIKLEILDVNDKPIVEAEEAPNATNDIKRSVLTVMPRLKFVSLEAGTSDATSVKTATELTNALSSTGDVDVILEDNITVNAITSNGNTNIDLNGHSLTVNYYVYPKTGSLTITDGTIDNTNAKAAYAVYVQSGATLKMDNVTIETKAANYAIYCNDKSNVQLDNVTINASTTQAGIQTKNNDGSSTINANNLTIDAKFYGLWLLGNNTSTIEDSHIKGGYYGIYVQENTNCTLKNTEVTAESGQYQTHALMLTNNSTAFLEGCTLKTIGAAGNSALFATNSGNIQARNCTLIGGTYGITTNAAGVDECVYLLDGCSISGDTGILFNINGTLQATNCTITGLIQSVIARGGSTTLNHCDLIVGCSANESEVDKINRWVARYTNSAAWASGNQVPLGALIMGNRGDGSAYNYPTKVKVVNGTKFSANFEGYMANNFYLTYAYGHEDETIKNSVTYTYDNTTVFNPATCCGTAQYDGDAVTVNGVKQNQE